MSNSQGLRAVWVQAAFNLPEEWGFAFFFSILANLEEKKTAFSILKASQLWMQNKYQKSVTWLTRGLSLLKIFLLAQKGR